MTRIGRDPEKWVAPGDLPEAAIRRAEIREALEAKRIERRRQELGLTQEDVVKGVEVTDAPTHSDVPPARMRVAPQAPPLPSREELAEYAMDVYRRALKFKKTVVMHRGGKFQTIKVPDPDFYSATQALKAVAEVAGYGALRRMPAPTREEEVAESKELAAEEALAKMKARV
jgi:hypothetical protein